MLLIAEDSLYCLSARIFDSFPGYIHRDYLAIFSLHPTAFGCAKPAVYTRMCQILPKAICFNKSTLSLRDGLHETEQKIDDYDSTWDGGNNHNSGFYN